MTISSWSSLLSSSNVFHCEFLIKTSPLIIEKGQLYYKLTSRHLSTMSVEYGDFFQSAHVEELFLSNYNDCTSEQSKRVGMPGLGSQ